MVSSLNQVFQQYGENKNNLVVLGISLSPVDNQERIEKFRKDNKGQYPEIEGTKYGVGIFSKYRSFLGNGYPSLVLIDPKTKEIIWHQLGYKTYQELDAILTEKGIEKLSALPINIPDSKEFKNRFSIQYMYNNTLFFNAPIPDSYIIKLFSPKGNILESQVYNVGSPGVQAVRLNHGKVSNGNYLVRIFNKFQRVSTPITVLK